MNLIKDTPTKWGKGERIVQLNIAPYALKNVLRNDYRLAKLDEYRPISYS